MKTSSPLTSASERMRLRSSQPEGSYPTRSLASSPSSRRLTSRAVSMPRRRSTKFLLSQRLARKYAGPTSILAMRRTDMSLRPYDDGTPDQRQLRRQLARDERGAQNERWRLRRLDRVRVIGKRIRTDR